MAIVVNRTVSSANEDALRMLNVFYPVGSYYETSDVDFDPNISWGGTWVEDSAGRITVAVDTGTFDTVGDTGGAESVSHKHWQSGGADGDHYYDLTNSEATAEGLGSRKVTKSRVSISTSSSSGAMRQTSTYDATTSTLQPYVIVKRWHRVS